MVLGMEIGPDRGEGVEGGGGGVEIGGLLRVVVVVVGVEDEVVLRGGEGGGRRRGGRSRHVLRLRRRRRGIEEEADLGADEVEAVGEVDAELGLELVDDVVEGGEGGGVGLAGGGGVSDEGLESLRYLLVCGHHCAPPTINF